MCSKFRNIYQNEFCGQIIHKFKTESILTFFAFLLAKFGALGSFRVALAVLVKVWLIFLIITMTQRIMVFLVGLIVILKGFRNGRLLQAFFVAAHFGRGSLFLVPGRFAFLSVSH